MKGDMLLWSWKVIFWLKLTIAVLKFLLQIVYNNFLILLIIQVKSFDLNKILWKISQLELSIRSIHHSWSNYLWIQHSDPHQLLSFLRWKNQVQGTQKEKIIILTFESVSEEIDVLVTIVSMLSPWKLLFQKSLSIHG